MYYIGTVTGTSGACYNDVTGPSGIGTFSIPTGIRALYLVPSASGVDFAMGHLATNFGATGLAQGRGAQLTGPGVINGPFRIVQGNAVRVAVMHNQAGFVSVRVFGAPTS